MPLPPFGVVAVHKAPLADGVGCEAEWMASAADTGRATAHLWRAPVGLVVPRSYARLPRWAPARAASAAAGWPVQVRASGGGLVPQGPGVLNLSLVWRSESATPSGTDAIYRAFCGSLAEALSRLAIVATPQPVPDSFCDGRFNLAVGGRKLVGTAQSWRRLGGQPVVLVHAVLTVTADPEALAAMANAFENAAGSDRRYRVEALGSVARAWCEAHDAAAPPTDLEAQLVAVLAEQFSHVI